MRKLTLFSLVLILMGSGACAQKNDKKRSDRDAELNSKMDSISYVFGASLGQNIRTAEIDDVNLDAIMAGVEHALEDDSVLIISMRDGDKLVREYMTKKQAEAAEKSMSKANEYLGKLADDENLQSTESGIYYEVIESGDGPKPEATDVVKVHYEGKTTEGEVFDSSYKRGQPAEFPLNRVIPGWTEVLQLMPVGSTWRVIIPPALAYGKRGSPPTIGPNEVLIFKIELLEIVEQTEE